ncbi:putative minus-end-directed kinesin ATPase [Helianthus annuus]|uniref:Kinesin-like protein n=1 Tax=Helianthus annuus TaxID=4232 RepID=A0A251STZ0_HELAN|nr:kinesin-like protein KIN-14N [Helianthus annuus]KAF5773858.1 putative minus-end-directed kinesin ATPase [Helianthus annuus]KAJ0498122.1 putative minus-end-directed kinesin ATPase [Helianthus annuus]
MVRPANGGGKPRQVLSEVNGDQEPGIRVGSGSVAGSDCGGFEFCKEGVEALLNERKITKNMSLKEKCDVRQDYIKRLRMCIKCFQEHEVELLLKQEQDAKKLESAEKRCGDLEMLMSQKEEELNSIIMELRKNCTALQEKFAKEESEKSSALESLTKEKDARLSAERSHVSVMEELERAQRECSSANEKISSLNDMYKRLQEYNTGLQQYNSKLQSELNQTHEALKHAEKQKAVVVENLSNLRGHCKSLQDQLNAAKTSSNETMKLKEALASEVGRLRLDLQQVRDDRDRVSTQVQDLSTEVSKYKEWTGKSTAELGNLTTKSNELEATCSSQSNLIKKLLEKLAAAENKLEMSDLSAFEIRTGYEEQQRVNSDLQLRLADAELKLVEGESLRKKLHNTILELKGNIRVFCRVRPLLSDDGADNEPKTVSFPTTTDNMGRGIELLQNGQKHSFIFDKVFVPESSQEDVFVEVSQLVQSALDGYKVCIFAYGQTGSGKTHTMMGTPGSFDDKGLIPRSLEQIFESRQTLQNQGWKYDMQVSMLEIYNETIRDLLTTNRPGSTELGTKQYAIKHDANGNTHVSDLTVVDVCSSREVSFLLSRAAQSRSVGKTQMNEQSSRSHFVFTMRITGVNEGTEQQVQGVLNLIDLAGSERLSKSGSTGDRLKETQAINKSLSSLSDVIFALAKKEEHVPYRNSKLTYLLQPCLGGDSKTLMVVNVSPAPSSLNESLCSLRFAARVNACEIGTPRRQTSVKAFDARFSYG